MNIDANIFNKILGNLGQQYLKSAMHHDQVGFTSGMQKWFNIQKTMCYITLKKKKNDKNNVIISIEAGNVFYKIQHPFLIKLLIKVHIKRIYLNIIKTIYDKLTAKVIHSGEKFFL